MNRALVQQISALLPIFLNSMMTNCATSWMANAVYFMSQPNHRPSATIAECGYIASCFQVGRILLAVPGGIWADKYGTQHMVILIGCIQLSTWIAMSMSDSLWVIFVNRFLQGCASGLANSAGMNLVGEICSPEYRGTFVGLQKIIATLGNTIEGSLAIFSDSYKVTVYATTALALLFFPTIPWITESPYFLMGVSKYEETKRVLQRLRKGRSQEEISFEYESLKRFVEKDKSSRCELNWIQNLAAPSTRKPLLCCILLSVLIVTNGTNVMNLYATIIFPPTKYFSSSSYPLILSMIQLASSMLTVLFIDALPRRHLYMLSAFLSFLIQSANGFVYYEYSTTEDPHQRAILKWSFLGGVLIFWILSNALLQPLCVILRSEILPLGIRGLGNSVCVLFQATAGVVCFQLFAYVQVHFGTALNFAVFSASSLLIVVVVYFLVPETRGKTLSEVHAATISEEVPQGSDGKSIEQEVTHT